MTVLIRPECLDNLVTEFSTLSQAEIVGEGVVVFDQLVARWKQSRPVCRCQSRTAEKLDDALLGFLNQLIWYSMLKTSHAAPGCDHQLVTILATETDLTHVCRSRPDTSIIVRSFKYCNMIMPQHAAAY